MGNEFSGVLRDDDTEVSVKLLIKKRKDQSLQLAKPQQQLQQQLQQQQQDNGSVPSDDSEEEDEEDEEDEEFEGDEEDEVDPEDSEEEAAADDAKLVDELLQGEGKAAAAAAVSASGKRRGRPPKSAAAASGSPSAAAAKGEAEDGTPERKRRKFGAGRPSSVKVRTNSANPILDICIAKTHLCPSYCLNVPPEFSSAYMDPNKEYKIADGGPICKTLGLCVKNKRCAVKRSHWKQFVDEQKLKCGDIVHLELLPSGDEIRMQVTKCEDVSEDPEQKPLAQNGLTAVAPIDLEKQLTASAAVEAAPTEAPAAEVPAEVAPAATAAAEIQ